MTSNPVEDLFDENLFVTYLLAFGIPFLVVLIAWIIIMDKSMHWRPQRWARFAIANTLKKELNNGVVTFVYMLWWIFFLLPFLISIAFGVLAAIKLKPFILGVTIAVAPTALIVLMIAVLGFENKGYRLNTMTKLQIGIAIFLMFAAYVAVVVCMDPQSWMATGYLFLWPPLTVYAFAILSKRFRITDKTIERILNAEESKEAFIQDMFDDKFIGWLEGNMNGRIGIVWVIVIVITSVICNGAYIWYWYGKDQQYATIGTGGASLLLDILIIVSQYYSPDQSKTLSLLFIVYIMKAITVTFSFQYWFIGHGFLFVVLGVYFITRFVDWLLIAFIKDGESQVISSQPIDPTVENAIKKLAPKRRHITTSEAVSSVIALALLIAGIGCELGLLEVDNLKELPFGLTQKNGTIALVVFTICMGLCVSTLISIYENKLKITIPMFIVFLIGAITSGCFFYLFTGLDPIMDFKVIIFLIGFFIFATVLVAELLVGNHYRLYQTKFCGNFSDIVLFIALVLDIAAAVCLVVFPFVFGNKGDVDFNGLLIFLAIGAVFLYIGFSAKFLDEEHFGKRAAALLAACIIVWAGFCGTLFVVTSEYIVPIVIFCIGICVGLYVFSILWCRAKGWLFTIGPMLIMAITSALLLAAGVAGFFLTDQVFLCSIIAFVGSFVMFGALTFFFLQKDDYDFHWQSITFLCLDVVCAIAIIVALFFYMDVFIALTACCFIIFLIAILGVFGYLSAQDECDVIAFSNIFFPIRRYRNGKTSEIPVFSVCFILTFVMPWIWGLIACAFFQWPQFGALGTSFGFCVAIFMITIMLYRFDFSAFSSVQYMERQTIEFAVNKAIKGSNATVGDDDLMPEEKDDTYENFVIWDAALQAQGEERSVFMSALKAQMYISANVAFHQCLEKINRYFTDHEIACDFMEQKTFTLLERKNLFRLLETINGTSQKTEEDKKRKDYDEYVRKQEESRAKRLAEIAKKSAQVAKETAKDFKKVIDNTKKSKEKFVDKDFHPQAKIEENPKLLKDCTWERAETLFKGSMTGKTNANELCQGAIGDCYLISAMASLSSKPALVASLFEDPNSYTSGAVCIKFNIMGQQVPVMIDTQIPVKARKDGSKSPRFVKPRDPENSSWWFTMVEKAYAKQNGSYTAITGGHSHVAFYRLIGGWPEIFNMDDLEIRERINNGDLWRSMLKWIDEGYICAGSHAGSDTTKNEKQIVQGHAYSVLQVKEIKGFKLLQLRNPWGDSEWTGDWSDKSPLWTKHPDVAKALGHSDVDDGMFWITFKDFTLNYSLLFVDISMDRGYNKKEIRGKLVPGATDGSKPVTKSPPANNLKQFVLRFSKTPTKPVKMTFERTGPSIETWVYGAINGGNAIGKLRKGMVYKSEAIARNSCVESWEWTLTAQQAAEPWTIVACRNPLKDDTDYLITIWCDVPFEVSELEPSSSGNEVKQVAAPKATDATKETKTDKKPTTVKNTNERKEKV